MDADVLRTTATAAANVLAPGLSPKVTPPLQSRIPLQSRTGEKLPVPKGPPRALPLFVAPAGPPPCTSEPAAGAVKVEAKPAAKVGVNPVPPDLGEASMREWKRAKASADLAAAASKEAVALRDAALINANTVAEEQRRATMAANEAVAASKEAVALRDSALINANAVVEELQRATAASKEIVALRDATMEVLQRATASAAAAEHAASLADNARRMIRRRSTSGSPSRSLSRSRSRGNGAKGANDAKGCAKGAKDAKGAKGAKDAKGAQGRDESIRDLKHRLRNAERARDRPPRDSSRR